MWPTLIERFTISVLIKSRIRKYFRVISLFTFDVIIKAGWGPLFIKISTFEEGAAIEESGFEEIIAARSTQ